MIYNEQTQAEDAAAAAAAAATASVTLFQSSKAHLEADCGFLSKAAASAAALSW